jgi:hypothetical protein
MVDYELMPRHRSAPFVEVNPQFVEASVDKWDLART